MKKTALMACVTAACLFGAAGIASAELSGAWVLNPDGAITGYRTYDLVLTTGTDWTNSRLELDLNAGDIWQHPTLDDEGPQPGLWAANPDLEWDSFVSAPNLVAPQFATASGDGWTATSVHRSWFDTVSTGGGTFVAARLTVSADAEDSFSAMVFDVETAGEGITLTGTFPPDVLMGDTNLDGTVDGLDLTALASNWNTSEGTWGKGDLNADGTVDGLDLTALAANWNATGTGGLVPEPASALLLLAGGAALVRRRRRS